MFDLTYCTILPLTEHLLRGRLVLGVCDIRRKSERKSYVKAVIRKVGSLYGRVDMRRMMINVCIGNSFLTQSYSNVGKKKKNIACQ